MPSSGLNENTDILMQNYVSIQVSICSSDVNHTLVEPYCLMTFTSTTTTHHSSPHTVQGVFVWREPPCWSASKSGSKCTSKLRPPLRLSTLSTSILPHLLLPKTEAPAVTPRACTLLSLFPPSSLRPPPRPSLPPPSAHTHTPQHTKELTFAKPPSRTRR